MPVLLSGNVGLPRDVAWQGRTVHTGVWKQPVPGPQMVRRLNIDGDGQGDLADHGGEQRAVLVYQIQSYRHWQDHFGRPDLPYGQFGENLTVDGLPDDEVCIGDRDQIGEAEFEVTQPRVTCYRVDLRFGAPDLPALLVSHRRPGFSMRVIREGHVQAGWCRPASASPRSSPCCTSSWTRRAPARVAWIHTARGPAEHPLAAGAHDLLARLRHATEHVFSTAATAAERRRVRARAGRPTRAKLARLAIPAEAHAYLCGPAGFMADVHDALMALGVDGARIHTELFGARPSINPGIRRQIRVVPHVPADAPGTAPLVTFARSGIPTRLPASVRNVLELAEVCDVNTRWSCRTGVCHTCVTPLLSGEVTYEPDRCWLPPRRRAHLLRPPDDRHRRGPVARTGVANGRASPRRRRAHISGRSDRELEPHDFWTRSRFPA